MSKLWSCWSGTKQVKPTSALKCHVLITKKASDTIKRCMYDADNDYEVGGVLIGYKIGRVYLVVAATFSTKDKNSSRASFVLDGAEHTGKIDEIVSGYMCSPSVLGIWHSHICDGHNFSEQDKASHKILVKLLGGTLSMLVTKPAESILLSVSHISMVGIEEDCILKIQAKNGMEVTAHERK